ncbi:succinate dehydrogenase cytochrome b560 subunit, mitochondrial-like [Anopheles cruzii]|uniref:succinate dehydrogenase cytochrome b560 subunit, mitochondrial-like n=1 Tax=Anopheles cruzii TaxID=68878 RepID=UPI0022EC20F5|nr:succinate dehydrogenase cytochrome b560 subunit, mitochondrial-like [Anopheles cruzii]
MCQFCATLRKWPLFLVKTIARASSLRQSASASKPNEEEGCPSLRQNHQLSGSQHFKRPMSITHRFTGMALTGYITVLGLGALALPHDATHYLTMLEGLSAPTLIALKFMIAYPFAYHTVNGVRHLFWDLGKFLTIKEVYTTGYTMLGVSGVLAGVLTAL